MIEARRMAAAAIVGAWQRVLIAFGHVALSFLVHDAQRMVGRLALRRAPSTARAGATANSHATQSAR